MKPVEFLESNTTFTRPTSMTEEQCESIRGFQGLDTFGDPCIITAWEPSEEEIQEIIKNRKVYMITSGTGLVPAAIAVFNPFAKS